MQTIDIREKDGRITQYVCDKFGVIKQLYPEKFTYDASYCSTYDKPQYRQASMALQRLRLGFVEATFQGKAESLIDCGYGNGAFLSHVVDTASFDLVYGYDVSNVPVPHGCEKINTLNVDEGVDIITFWDCLEHFPDLSFLEHLNAQMLVVSLPWCHFRKGHAGIGVTSEEWFTSWHHRKPNEHLFHFDKQSLIATLDFYGWKCVATTNIEDIVRKPKDDLKNILTAAFVNM